MKERVEDALRLVDMLDFKEHNPAQLSGGQKQRVAIASVLALKPSIIIFDEALNMLDPTSRQELLVTLQKLRRTEQITFLSITHDMDEAALADRILSLKNGRIVTSGTPGEVFTSAPDLEVPFPERLRRELGKRGRNVPNQYMTEKEMVEWLWK